MLPHKDQVTTKFSPKNSNTKKNWDQKIFWSEKFGSKKISSPKNFLVRKFFLSKNLRSKKIVGKKFGANILVKNFGPKKFRVENFFWVK